MFLLFSFFFFTRSLYTFSLFLFLPYNIKHQLKKYWKEFFKCVWSLEWCTPWERLVCKRSYPKYLLFIDKLDMFVLDSAHSPSHWACIYFLHGETDAAWRRKGCRLEQVFVFATFSLVFIDLLSILYHACFSSCECRIGSCWDLRRREMHFRTGE